MTPNCLVFVRLLLAAIWFALAVPAQDDVLAAGSLGDLRARDACIRTLRSVRSDVHLDGASARDVCRTLATLAGGKVTFALGGKADDFAAASISVDLRNASLWTAMAVVAHTTEFAFVMRAGVVFLMPKSAIKPALYVVVYDLRAECAPLRNFPGPDLRLPGTDDDGLRVPPPEDSGTTVSGFTAEGIESLLRANVTPDRWDTDGVRLTNTNGLFVVRHSPAGHAEVRRLLRALGLLPVAVAVVR